MTSESYIISPVGRSEKDTVEIELSAGDIAGESHRCSALQSSIDFGDLAFRHAYISRPVGTAGLGDLQGVIADKGFGKIQWGLAYVGAVQIDFC